MPREFPTPVWWYLDRMPSSRIRILAAGASCSILAVALAGAVVVDPSAATVPATPLAQTPVVASSQIAIPVDPKPSTTPVEQAAPEPRDSAAAVVVPSVIDTSATGPVVDPAWPANDGYGCPAPRYPTTLNSGSPAQGTRVLIIGDSRTRDSRLSLLSGLKASGWTPTIRCWGWKHISWGISQVKRARQLHQLPKWIVISLGVNDMGNDSPDTLRNSIDAMLNAIGPNHKILWLEEYSTRSPRTFSDSHVDYPAKVKAFNRHLRARAGSSTGLSVIPWVSVAVANHLNLFDGIHYTAFGYRLRAHTVVAGLNKRITGQ